MKVQVLFFGATAEAVGERQIEINLKAEIKSAVAFKQVISAYPNLQKHSLLFAVNQEYANGEEFIKEGDELAIFTAVSGG